MLLEDAAEEGDSASAVDLERIHEAGHHLLHLINEVLDLSKIEAGKMDLTVQTVDAAVMIRDIVESCRAGIEKNGNVVSLELTDRLGVMTCDLHRVTQALTQILDNAGKFTEKGRVTVSATREPGSAGDEIRIAVRDTGIGIAPEVVPELFEKFSVADDSTASKYGGTGLGLTLSQKLCRLMGGDISVESRFGAGSCFTLHLPVTPVSVLPPSSEDAAAERDEAGPLLAAA
jgi:signal transduction histidine kinase